MREPQKRIYDFIVQYTTEHLYSPSVQDICEGVGYKSKSTVFEHLRKLEDMGMISFGGISQPRCIKLIGYKLVKGDGL